MGPTFAFKYFSLATEAEKAEIIKWFSAGKIATDDVRKVYPDLFHYMQQTFGTREDSQTWCLTYLDQYKKAKLSNTYTPEVESVILEKNASEVTFRYISGLMALAWNGSPSLLKSSVSTIRTDFSSTRYSLQEPRFLR